MLDQIAYTGVKQLCAENKSPLSGVRSVFHTRPDQHGHDVGNLAYRIRLSRVPGATRFEICISNTY
jgi:hypothetical protein